MVVWGYRLYHLNWPSYESTPGNPLAGYGVVLQLSAKGKGKRLDGLGQCIRKGKWKLETAKRSCSLKKIHAKQTR